jgi:hypothetical protein
MATVLETLRAELSALDAALNADPRVQKLQKLRELIALYEAEVAEAVRRSGHQPRLIYPGRASQPTKASAMMESVTGLLRSRGTVHRKEILAHLQEQGIMGGEGDPMAYLAKFFSMHRDVFAADGKGNFSLCEMKEAAE